MCGWICFSPCQQFVRECTNCFSASSNCHLTCATVSSHGWEIAFMLMQVGLKNYLLRSANPYALAVIDYTRLDCITLLRSR